MRASYQLKFPLYVSSVGIDAGEMGLDGFFDTELANVLAKHESYNKHLYRPNTYLHKWWARRCGSTFRLILKGLVEKDEQRDYYSSGGLEGKVILDPMMGGCTTLHEAIRLGANVIGADIDPIPVLQARATLSGVPLDQLEEAFDMFYHTLSAKLSPYFKTSCPECGVPTDVRFTLYGINRACGCKKSLAVDSTVLRHEPDGSVIQICPLCHAVNRGDKPCGCLGKKRKLPLVEKSIVTCLECGTTYKEDHSKPFFARYTPLVIVGSCPEHGLFFKEPAQSDLKIIKQTDSIRQGLSFGPIDDFTVKPGPKSTGLLRRGVTSYLDLFSSRQLLYLRSAIDSLQDHDPLVRLNLALLVSTSLEFNSMLCGYKGADVRRPGAIRHTFSHHAYSFPYTALENNPVHPNKSSGTLQGLFNDRIRRARKWAMRPQERFFSGKGTRIVALEEEDAGSEAHSPADLRKGTHRFYLIQGSSASLDLKSESIDHIVTDPPYFDSVQYSDLAAFFRVWLKKMLPADIEWDYDLNESAVDPHANGNGRYTEALSAIFAECHRVLRKDHGRLVFTFHHWNPKGWAALTIALKHAGFVLINRYVVHSENPVSVHISNLKALTHDAILVLAAAGSCPTLEWSPPSEIDMTDSRKFCEGCAALLGWMLYEQIGEKEIVQKWLEMLS